MRKKRKLKVLKPTGRLPKPDAIPATSQPVLRVCRQPDTGVHGDEAGQGKYLVYVNRPAVSKVMLEPEPNPRKTKTKYWIKADMSAARQYWEPLVLKSCHLKPGGGPIKMVIKEYKE